MNKHLRGECSFEITEKHTPNRKGKQEHHAFWGLTSYQFFFECGFNMVNYIPGSMWETMVAKKPPFHRTSCCHRMVSSTTITRVLALRLVAFPAFPTKIATHQFWVPLGGHAAFGRLPKQETGRRGRSQPNNPNPSRWRSFPAPGRTVDAPGTRWTAVKWRPQLWRFPQRLAGGIISSKFHNWSIILATKIFADS